MFFKRVNGKSQLNRIIFMIDWRTFMDVVCLIL
jgi:hypothetical protein